MQSHHYKELQTDILNIPNHIFGDYKQCKERSYKCEDDCEEKLRTASKTVRFL